MLEDPLRLADACGEVFDEGEDRRAEDPPFCLLFPLFFRLERASLWVGDEPAEEPAELGRSGGSPNCKVMGCSSVLVTNPIVSGVPTPGHEACSDLRAVQGHTQTLFRWEGSSGSPSSSES